jgi:hypothetical protein
MSLERAGVGALGSIVVGILSVVAAGWQTVERLASCGASGGGFEQCVSRLLDCVGGLHVGLLLGLLEEV